MEFTIKRNLLLAELNLVQGVVEKKSTIPILSNILLSVSGEHLDIVATDLDVSICCGCEADVKAEGTATLSARRLFEIIRLLPEDIDISFLLLENDWVRIRAGKSEYKVVGLPQENFPSVPEGTDKGMELPGNLLRSMIQRTIFAITQEESRYSLNGALLILTPENVRMVVTDGHRLALVTHGEKIGGVEAEIRALIPRKTLVELQKLIGEQEMTVDFERDENHLFFRVGTKRLISRVLAGQFPNYEMVLPQENDKEVKAGSRALTEGVRRAAVMSDEKIKAVRFGFNTGNLELTASSADAGEAREEVEIEYVGEEVQIGFNPQYVLDFLSVCGSNDVVVSIKDGETQAMFRPCDKTELDYQYVVMPMKI